jgi:hypothetical protein
MTQEERAARIKAYEAAAKLREDLADAKPKDPKAPELRKFAVELRELAAKLKAEGEAEDALTDPQGSA